MVQTFVPYADFEACARVLDVKRLGKRRVEVVQIVRSLTVPGYAWGSHPAVLMWKGFEEALGRYGLIICEVWGEQGFGDTCAQTIRTDLAAAGIADLGIEQPSRQRVGGEELVVGTDRSSVTARRWSARTRAGTPRCSPAYRATWSTCGRCGRRWCWSASGNGKSARRSGTSEIWPGPGCDGARRLSVAG